MRRQRTAHSLNPGVLASALAGRQPEHWPLLSVAPTWPTGVPKGWPLSSGEDSAPMPWRAGQRGPEGNGQGGPPPARSSQVLHGGEQEVGTVSTVPPVDRPGSPPPSAWVLVLAGPPGEAHCQPRTLGRWCGRHPTIVQTLLNLPTHRELPHSAPTPQPGTQEIPGELPHTPQPLPRV